MNYKIDRTTFSCGANSTIKSVNITDESKIIIVDDFYDNPDKVRDLCFNVPLFKANWNPMISLFRSYRNKSDFGKYWDTYVYSYSKWLLEQHFNHSIGYDNTDGGDRFSLFSFNGKDYKSGGMIAPPHQDSVDLTMKIKQFAAVIYLNTDDECRGGTGFYKHKETNIQNTKDMIDYTDGTWDSVKLVLDKFVRETNEKCVEWISDTDEVWELLYLAEMKYNRAIFYSGDNFHSPYIKKGWFEDYNRITQPLFLQ